MKQRILFLFGITAVMLFVYGCSDTTDIPQERLNAGKKFRDSHSAGAPTGAANTENGMSKYVGSAGGAGR